MTASSAPPVTAVAVTAYSLTSRWATSSIGAGTSLLDRARPGRRMYTCRDQKLDPGTSSDESSHVSREQIGRRSVHAYYVAQVNQLVLDAFGRILLSWMSIPWRLNVHWNMHKDALHSSSPSIDASLASSVGSGTEGR